VLMALTAWTYDRSKYGGFPSASSIAVIPTDQMSAFIEYFCYFDAVMTSGAIQQIVPLLLARSSSASSRTADC